MCNIIITFLVIWTVIFWYSYYPWIICALWCKTSNAHCAQIHNSIKFPKWNNKKLKEMKLRQGGIQDGFSWKMLTDTIPLKYLINSGAINELPQTCAVIFCSIWKHTIQQDFLDLCAMTFTWHWCFHFTSCKIAMRCPWLSRSYMRNVCGAFQGSRLQFPIALI